MLRHLLFADTSEDLPPARIMLKMRGTLFTLFQKCRLNIEYAPDQKLVLEYLEATKKNDKERAKIAARTWKTTFYEERAKYPLMLEEFALVENALTICIGPSSERPNMHYIILFSKRKQLKKSEMELYKEYVTKHKFTKCMLIAEDCTAHARNYLSNLDDDKVSFVFVIYDKLQSHWFENNSVPDYRFLSVAEQKAKFKKRYIRDPKKLPMLLKEDSASLQTFASKGDYVEGWDRSITAGYVPLMKIVE